MNKTIKFYGSYRGLKKSPIFIKEVVRFLMILENNYGNLIPKEALKQEFGENYERITTYLHDERESEDTLIIGNEKGWRINNRNFDKIQELISRSISEDAVYSQKLSAEKQSEFNRYLLLATISLALIGFYQIYVDLLNSLGLQEWKDVVLFFVGLLILALIFRLTYLLFKNKIF